MKLDRQHLVDCEQIFCDWAELGTLEVVRESYSVVSGQVQEDVCEYPVRVVKYASRYFPQTASVAAETLATRWCLLEFPRIAFSINEQSCRLRFEGKEYAIVNVGQKIGQQFALLELRLLAKS